MDAPLTIAEDQFHLPVDGDAEPLELLGIRGELQQCGHFGAAGELAVLHAVGAVGRPHEEVGVPDERDRQVARLPCVVRAVDEGGLHDDGNAALQRVEGLLGVGLDGV